MTRGARPTIFCALLAALVIAALLPASQAAAAPSPAGRWVGEVDTPDGKKAQIYLDLEDKSGSWSGSLEDPLQGTAALSDLKVSATAVKFRYQPAGAPFGLDFSGSYVAGEDRLSGTFSMQGDSRTVTFKRVSRPAEAVAIKGAGMRVGTAAVDTTKAAVRTKHPYRLAVTGRLGWWASLHSVKDETYTINNLTAAAPGMDAAIKLYPLDGMAVFVRGVRAGQNVTDDAALREPFERNGLTADSYLSLDGIEFGMAGYLGRKLMPNSHFNPYLTGGVGRYKWAMTTAGRGTVPVEIEQVPVEGTDIGGWFGAGTEYALGGKLALDFECSWRFFLTRDTKVWRNSESTWGNTLALALSAGVTYGF
jgi:opacity protein-like surface antigen